MRQRHHARLRLQQLEGRDTPGNLTVSFAAVTGTLTVTGDGAANQVTVSGDPADPTHFSLSSPTDTFNGAPGPFATASGVKNLVFRMGAGNDAVGLANSPPIQLAGSLTVDGGDGANQVTAADLTVARGVTIRNGTNAAGTDIITLLNLNVGRGVTVANGEGDTSTEIKRTTAGLSTVRGSVSVTNGTGSDNTALIDLNVGGNVTVRNGKPNAGGITQSTYIFNDFNTIRSVVRGNVLFTHTSGAGFTGLWDVDVGGNVTLAVGSGSFTTSLDGYRTQVPVLIHGNLTITGSGANAVNLGQNLANVGVDVGRNLTVISGAGPDTVQAYRLRVGGATRIALGDGDTTTAIDDSVFAGTFTLTAGAGSDTLDIEPRTGTTGETLFHKAFLVRFGTGWSNTMMNGFDVGQAVLFGATAVIHTGPDGGGLGTSGSRVVLPFGLEVQFGD